MAASNRYVYSIAALVAVGGFNFGYDTGIISGVLVMTPFINYFGITPANANDLSSNIVSILQLGGLVGALVQSYVSDWFGRKWTIVGSGSIFVVGAILQTVSVNIPMLFVARAISGFGLAIFGINIAMYNAEIAPTEIRGRIVGLQQLMVAFGIAIAYWINYGFQTTTSLSGNIQWQLPLGLQIIPALILVIGILPLPRSPRWLALKGRSEEARATLAKIRQLDVDDPKLVEEWVIIEEFVELHRNSSWAAVFQPQNIPRLLIGLPLILFQQFTGQNMINYFAPKVFNQVGITGTSVQLLATGLVGTVKAFTTIFGIIVMDKAGRRTLLLSGTLIMAISFYYVGTFVRLNTSASLGAGAYIAILFIYIYMVGYAYSWGIIHYVLPAEIYPVTIRAKAETLGGLIDWAFQYVSIKIAPYAISSLGPSGDLFLVWGGLLTFFAVWIFFFVPETKKVPLEQMDSVFKKKGIQGGLLGHLLRDNEYEKKV